MKPGKHLLLQTKAFKRYYHLFENGESFTEDVKVKFDDWLDNKGLRSKFSSMPTQDKLKVFLSWKWGSEDGGANVALEMTSRDDFELRITPEYMSRLDKFAKEFWERKIYFEEQCNKIKAKYGLPLTKISASNKVFHSTADEPKHMSLDDISKAILAGELL